MDLEPSELILRDDHSIYHLALRPEDLAPTVILVGDPARVPLVSRYFDTLELTRQNREFLTHTGRIGKKRVSVLSTGIGTGNIDIALNELDALARIDLENRRLNPEPRTLDLIRLGTCGGLDPDIEVNSYVASNWAIGFDGLLHHYTSGNAKADTLLEALKNHFGSLSWFPEPYAFRTDESLLNALAADPEVYRGMTITQGGFYAPQGRSLRLAPREPDLIRCIQGFAFEGVSVSNMEMETAALFGLSSLLGHRAASCSVVLANRPAGSFSDKPKEAVVSLIEYCLEQISNISAPC